MQDKLYWTSEDWTPEFEGIKERYTMTPSIVSAYRTMQNEWFNDGNSVSRFSAVYGPLYKVCLPLNCSQSVVYCRNREWDLTVSVCGATAAPSATTVRAVRRSTSKGTARRGVGPTGWCRRPPGTQTTPTSTAGSGIHPRGCICCEERSWPTTMCTL